MAGERARRHRAPDRSGGSIGCSDREIYEFIAAGGSFDYRREAPSGADGVEAACRILRDLHHVRNDWSVPRLVEEVLARTQARITFLLTPQGEQRVSNLNKIVTLARALEESGLLSLRAFVRWLRDMEEQAVDEAEPPTVEPGDDVVRIMSIHGAKGLEFPIVVVPDLGRGPGGGPQHLLVNRVAGTSAVYMGKVGSHFLIQTRDYEELKTHQEHREAAERLRLLYVAMTRAKDALVLPMFPRASKGSMMSDLGHLEPDVPRFGHSHEGWLMVDGSKAPKVERDLPALRLRLPETPEVGAAAARDVNRSREEWLQVREASVSSAAAPEPVERPSAMIDQAALAALKKKGARLESERGGRKLGELVHLVLAVVPPDCPDLVDDFVRYFARHRGFSERLIGRGAALVRAALGSEVVRSALAGRSWREVPFAVATPKGVVEGAIDLLAADAEGAMVTDFKTDVVGAEARGEMIDLYAPQLQAYIRVVNGLGAGRVRAGLLLLRGGSAEFVENQRSDE